MAACDEYTLPNPPAQSNNQEPVFETSGLSVTDLTDGKLDLVTFSQNNTQPELLRYSVSNVPEGRAMKFVMEISDTEDFAKSAEVATTSGEDSVVRASVYDIETAYSHNILPQPRSCDSLYPLCRIREQHSPAPRTCVWAAPTTIWAPQPSPSLPCC